MSSSKRGLNFTVEEDIQLCHVYLDISQCPINGINQKKDALWERIAVIYNEGKSEERSRSGGSLQSRFSDLCLPVSKLRGHIRQIEYQNPSGASESYIFKKAKESLLDDSTYKKKKFQFDHVWPILKNAEKWLDNAAMTVPKPRRRKESSEGSQSGSRTSRTSDTLSFSVDLNADGDEQEYINDEVASHDRPMGTRMAKMKRKATDEKKKNYEKIMADNQAIKELLEKSMMERSSFASKFDHYTSSKLDIQRQREENKIMLTNLDSITDPTDREFLKMRKAEVMQRRARESQSQGSPPTTFGYGNFSNLNQFQSGSEATFHSGNFGSPLQFSSGFGGSGGSGGVPHAGGSSGFGTSSGGGVPQYNESGGFGTSDGYGGSDANLPEY
ncbi:hypothetical protein ABKV19_022739 [Rosa sericea]